MKNYKVNIDREKPSTEEILSRRDFDSVLKQFQASPVKVVKKPFWKSVWMLSSAVAAVIAVAAVVYTFNHDNATDNQQPSDQQQGPFVRTPDSLTGGTFLAEQKNRKIAPPLKGLDVSFSSYSVDAAKGGTICHASGSVICFKGKCFVDENGKEITGKVDVKYREMRDVVDFFVSGIPMQYDSAGTIWNFQSAGMLEIAAFQNGKVVYLKKDKPAEIDFKSSVNGPEFNLYRFDTTIGNWVYLGKDKVVERVNLNDKKVKENTPAHPAPEVVYQSELDKINEQYVVPEEPVKPKLADKTKNRFTVAFDPNEFPEMASYKNVIFEVDETREKFDRGNYNVTWESVKLSKGNAREKYIITLKKGLKNVDLDVYPVFDAANYEKAVKVFDEKFEAYQKALLDKQKAEQEAKARYDAMLKTQSIGNVITQIRADNNAANQQTASECMRVFQISGFGVYNCDKPDKYPQGVITKIHLKDQEGRTVSKASMMYQVDRNLFGLYYRFGNPIVNYSYNPASSNLFWCVIDGAMFYADNDQFSDEPEKQERDIVLKPVNRQFSNPDEMRAFFNITAKI
ncbi:MAG: hypothetical protein Fur0041_15810 [Bacteroidia bacterium]